MNTSIYELRKNREILNRVTNRILSISKMLNTEKLGFKFEYDPVKGEDELFKKLKHYKTELLTLDKELDIIYRSTQTKGRNYKFHENPGLIGDIRGNVQKLKNNLGSSITFVDVFVETCFKVSTKSGKNTAVWNAATQQIDILEYNKELEKTMNLIHVRPGSQELNAMISSGQVAEGGSILTMIMVVTAMIHGFLSKNKARNS